MKVIDTRGVKYGNSDYHRMYGTDTVRWFARSCGAVYVEKPRANISLSRRKLGFVVCAGKVKEEVVTPTYDITHVETKNGPITIRAKYVL